MPVRLMLRSMSSMEYTEWVAYFALKGLKPGEGETTDVSTKIKNALGAPPKKKRKKGD